MIEIKKGSWFNQEKVTSVEVLDTKEKKFFVRVTLLGNDSVHTNELDTKEEAEDLAFDLCQQIRAPLTTPHVIRAREPEKQSDTDSLLKALGDDITTFQPLGDKNSKTGYKSKMTESELKELATDAVKRLTRIYGHSSDEVVRDYEKNFREFLLYHGHEIVPG